MDDNNGMMRRADGGLAFDAEQRQILRDTYANGCSDGEFAVLMEVATQRGLNPFKREIFFVKRWDSDKHREVWQPQVSVDGLRLIAQRTGLYDGQDEPEFVEDADGTPKLCKVRVYRKDWTRPAVGVAYWSEYVQTTRDKQTGKTRPNSMWSKMPHTMLAKCAESLAIRKAFTESAAGLYTAEEMGQADNERPAPKPVAVEQRRPAIDATPAPLQLPSDNGRGPSSVATATAPEDVAPPVESPAPSDALKAAVGQVLRAETPDALARAFVSAEPDVKGSADELRSLWRATKDRAAALDIARETLDAAVVRVRAETAPNNEPPTPGGPKRPRRPATKATDAAGDVAANDAAVDAPGARSTSGHPMATQAQRRARLADLRRPEDVRTSWRHRAAMPPAGYREACAERVCALTPGFGIDDALAYLDAPVPARSVAAQPKRVAA